ncbi:hypothetical protein I6N96_13535 [Enterococcus sp. BWM-S5]|uniref:Uncharacterized protein n=1 Tax=Enterococcus larvae TaxID=2794352 RepID=A0ABS4CLJ2_9ENTE|nr:hypothetical protein [Enterococcus larvae]MBP1047300.1 hypothetical protein [Enterococcus larvae]
MVRFKKAALLLAGVVLSVVVIFLFYRKNEKIELGVDEANKVVISISNGSVLNFEDREAAITDKQAINQIIEGVNDLNHSSVKRVERIDLVGGTNYSVSFFKDELLLKICNVYGNFVTLGNTEENQIIYEVEDWERVSSLQELLNETVVSSENSNE